jgi:hypothetical protein
MGRYQLIKPFTYKVYEDADCKKCARKFFLYLESNSIENNNNFITLRDIDTNQTYTFEHKKRSAQYGGAPAKQQVKQPSKQNSVQNTAQDTTKKKVQHIGNSEKVSNGDKVTNDKLEDVEHRIKKLEVKVEALVGGGKEECKGLICPPGKDEEMCCIQ